MSTGGRQNASSRSAGDRFFFNLKKTVSCIFAMFLATAYGPRPAPNETMLLPSPVRPSTLGVVAADEQMSSSTHRRRNYPALTHSPQTFPSPLPRHEAKSPVLLPPPAFVTPIREGASDGAGPAYFPTPSSPTPSSPTPPRQVRASPACLLMAKKFDGQITNSKYPTSLRLATSLRWSAPPPSHADPDAAAHSRAFISPERRQLPIPAVAGPKNTVVEETNL